MLKGTNTTNTNKTNSTYSAKTKIQKLRMENGAKSEGTAAAYKCKNIGKLYNGKGYLARKTKNGVKYAQTFTLLRDAKSWVNSL